MVLVRNLGSSSLFVFPWRVRDGQVAGGGWQVVGGNWRVAMVSSNLSFALEFTQVGSGHWRLASAR